MAISLAIVVSSGRCGSTRLPDILNSHPDILSISELFILQGGALFHFRRLKKAARIPRPTPSKLGDLVPAECAGLAEACRSSLERLGCDLGES